MKFYLQRLSIAASVAVCVLPVQAGEVLGHISDETAPVITEPAKPAVNDRQIIYRVICSPDGEALPDCERDIRDTESVAQPEMPAQEVAAQEVAEPVAAEPVQPTKADNPKKTSSKKTASSKKKSASTKPQAKKKTAKKSTAKKSTAKKSSSKKK